MNENLGNKSLRRSTEQRILVGVCGGIAEFLGIDANIIRLVFAVLTLAGMSGVLLYIIMWLVLPERGASSSVLEDIIHNFQGKKNGS